MLNHGVVENSEISYFKALKSCFLLIFLASFLFKFSDQLITQQIEIMMKSEDGLTTALWGWLSIWMIISILFPIFITLTCVFALRIKYFTSFKQFIQQHLEMTLLETLRSWGKSFLWGLLFIIPGFIKMSFYLLVPYIVILNTDYKKGSIDALKLSEKISKKYWLKISFLFFIFFIFIPIFSSTFFDEWQVFDKHFLTAILFTAFDSILILLFNYLILKNFLNEIFIHSPHRQGEQNVINV